MGIHDGHRERMKEEFLQVGLDSFPDHRALELLLFYSRMQGDVNPIAHALLSTFRSLSGVMDAPIEELEKVPGVGRNTAVLLKLIPAMAAKYMQSHASSVEILSDSAAIKKLFQPHFFASRVEKVCLACCDNHMKLLGFRQLSSGIADATDVSVRKIAAEALALNASTVILAHNHPNGHPEPSDADLTATNYLWQNLKSLQITLYDHVILADDEMYSLRDNGYFQKVMAFSRWS